MKTSTSIIFIAFLALAAGCRSGGGAPAEEASHKEEEGEHANEKEHADEIVLTPEQVRTSGIELVKAARRPFGIFIETVGEIASDTDRLVQVRPTSSGTGREILVAVGDNVVAGQTLVRYASEGNSEELHELKAPQSGILVGLYMDDGSHIDPSVPVASIADTSKLRCTLDVHEKDITRVKKGQSVSIRVTALPEENFNGVVTYISPRVDEESRTVKVRVDVGNAAGKLKFGMFVTGRIQIGQRPALIVPESAIQNVAGEPTVFVADGNSFVPRRIGAGESSGGWVEVKSGLEGGESIAAKGSFILKSELQKGEMSDGHGH